MRPVICLGLTLAAMAGAAHATELDPLGACCLPNGACVLESELDCEQDGGMWLGAETPCMPNPCPQPMGACCVATSCFYLTLEACMGMGGQYWNSDLSCAPSPCIPSDAGDPTAVSPLALFGRASPNPSHGTIECEISLTHPAQVRVHLYDMSGRQVGPLMVDDLTLGTHHFDWQVRSPSGDEIPNGVYALRFEARALPPDLGGIPGEGCRALTAVQRMVFLR